MEKETPEPRRERPRLPKLSRGVRIALLVVGWGLMAVGVAGLALPGIQGVLTIALASAVLSLASETADRVLRSVLGRWPRLLRRVDLFRHKVHRKLHRRSKDPEADEEAEASEPDQSR